LVKIIYRYLCVLPRPSLSLAWQEIISLFALCTKQTQRKERLANHFCASHTHTPQRCPCIALAHGSPSGTRRVLMSR
jgi:hypothetical protein